MKRWIAAATRHKGALHRHLRIPIGQTIPLGVLEYNAEHGPTEAIRREARLALTLRGLRRKKGNRRP